MSFDAVPSTPTVQMRPKLFAKEAAKRMDWPSEQLEKIQGQGFGRTEIITMVFIAKKSTNTWESLVKQRQKGSTLRAMAERSGLNYKETFLKSMEMKKDIEAYLDTLPETSTDTHSSPERKSND